MLKYFTSLIAATLLMPITAHAHTIQLGQETVPGACAVVENGTESGFLFYKQKSNRVSQVGGKVKVWAVVLPTKPLPENAPDNLMEECGKRAYLEIKGQHNQEGDARSPEAVFRQALNQCLRSRGAPYQVSLVFLRRSDISCPN